MTPAELNTYARSQWNASSDGFFTDTEMYTYMYDAAMQLARETKCIRNVYTTSTVVDQHEYTRPSRAIAIKRITYEGSKLTKTSDRVDDAMTLNQQETTSTGTPQYYWEWSTTLLLRPVPAAVGTIKIYSYDMPDVVSASSTFDVPTRYHLDMSLFLLAKIAAKDKNFGAAGAYQVAWEKAKTDIKRQEAKLLRGDEFATVIDESLLPINLMGIA